MTTHGFREDFKKEEREKEKEKDDQEEDFSDQETKEKEKEREKEKVILLKMKVIGHMMNGKEMGTRIGMKAIGPMKMRQRGNPKAGMNGKNLMNMDTFKEKERKERQEKEKERKVMDHKIKEKDKVMGKVKQTTHSSQPALQQAALPSSASASGSFVTHSPSVKMTESEKHSMEPDFSGCAFLGQEPNPVQKVEEEGVAFHTENQMPPTVAILDLGCTRAMGSRNAVNAFCDYVLTTLTNLIVDYGTRLKKQAQDFSLQTHNKPSAQRNWRFTCMTRRGMRTPQSSTLWKKETCLC